MLKEHVEVLEILVQTGRATKEDLEAFSAQELEYLAQSTLEYLETGESLTMKEIESGDFDFEVPDIITFVEDPIYLGNELGYPLDTYGNPIVGESKQIYDFWLGKLEEIYMSGNSYSEILISGGIGIGKTTVMNVIQLYDLINLMSLKSPQRHYGLMPSTTIVLAFFNILKQLADDVGYSQFQAMMESSPFFRELMFSNIRMKEGFRLQPPRDKRIGFRVGSRVSHTLGVAVFSAQVDEANFGQDTQDKKADEKKSQVYQNYTSLLRRKESRFLNAPGHFCIGSSKRSTADFLEKHIEDSKGKEGVLVIDSPQYVVKKNVVVDGKKLYSGKVFRVLLGDITREPKILREDEEVKPELESFIEEVPIEHRKAYEDTIIDAIRDISGKASQPKSAFFSNRDLVRSVIDSDRLPPWKYTSHGKVIPNTINISFFGKDQISDYLVKERLFRKEGRLPYHQNSRFISIDTGVTQDACGIAMGCRGGSVKLEKEDGTAYFVKSYYTDFYIRVKGKDKEQFPLYKLTEFVKFLRTIWGIDIKAMTTDGYQATQLRQDVLIAFPSMDITLFSVDADDIPYTNMRNQFYSKAIEGFYHDKNALVELFDLIHIVTGQRGTHGNLRKMKVDHPTVASDTLVGRKDVMDALAAMLFNCREKDTSLSMDEIKDEMAKFNEADLDKVIKTAEAEADRALVEIDKLNLDDLFKQG